MALIVPGDALIATKQFLEAALVLSNQSPRPLLFSALDKDTSLESSIAFFIESLVLHERMFCTFSDKVFKTITSQSIFFDLSNLIMPMPFQELVQEMESQGNDDIGQLALGQERINSSPSIVVDRNALKVFNLAFPDLATESTPSMNNSSEITDDNKPKRGVTHQDAYSRHYMYYEKVASIAVGISYSRTEEPGFAAMQQSATALREPSGYKMYGDQTLTQTRNAAQEKAKRLNDWLQKSRFSVEAPIVFSYVLGKAKRKRDLLGVALDIRDSKEARAFRKQCALFDQALAKGDDTAAIEMVDEVMDKIKQLQSRIDGPKFKVDFSFPLSITISPTELLEFIQQRRKRHLIFISHLYKSSIATKDLHARLRKVL